MSKNKYTGDVAYYATIMALIEAARSCCYMQPKSNVLVLKSLDLLQQMVIDETTPEVRNRLSGRQFSALMQNFILNCGLNTMTVLQLISRYEKECEKNSQSC